MSVVTVIFKYGFVDYNIIRLNENIVINMLLFKIQKK
jgi:hypothetical protein